MAPPELSPLTPEFIDAEHGVYVQMLDAALKDKRIQNIALSGNYGVGKSSILKQLSETHKKKVLELSLSTLAPIEQTGGEDGPPPQATSPTNTIQQEIVKQLLYREKPRKMPGSRFRRIEKFHWTRESLLSLLLGTTLATTFLLTGWTSKIILALPSLKLEGFWPHLAVFGAGVLICLLLRHNLYGRFNIKEFSAGAATVTLDEKSVSYFDQYLDEIVYFFEVSKRTIVVFEDIDRFNDAHIFETLRSLNALLNGSPQIKERIYFIYAIKDSIFDRLTIARDGRRFNHDLQTGDDPAEGEVVRANRTKFFDLVIPVVPFITHQNARNLAIQLLKGMTHSIDLDLIDLASRYVPDMRLLKNVRNEFLIFRERILAADRGSLNLSETELFAMMLYKSTHLSDFEAIRIGKSDLDKVYAKSRTVVAANLERLQREIFELQRTKNMGMSIDSRSADLGKRLVAHIKIAVKAYQRDYEKSVLTVDGNPVGKDDLLTSSFWKNFIETEGDPILNVATPKRNYNETGLALSFRRSDLEEILGQFNAKAWERLDINRNNESQNSLQKEMRFLKSASLKDLMARDDLTINGATGGVSLDGATKEIFNTGLAYHLLKSGHINRNFTLYTAIFHGDRVSSAATNFIIHHIERDSRDENFPLTSDDIESIIRERSSQFGEPAFYNIDIVDHVLKMTTNHKVTELIINSLAKLGVEQKSFLDAYLKRGSERSLLIERITPIAPRVLDYLATEVEVAEIDRLGLFNTALANFPPKLNYVLGKKAAEFILDNYSAFEVLSSYETQESKLREIADLIERAGLILSSLAPLSREARKIFVAKNLYEITLENLQIALGDSSELSLDVIRATNEGIYAYVTAQLSRYLSCIEGVSPSVSHQNSFDQVLVDTASADMVAIEKLLKLASEECILDDVIKVPAGKWGLLAKAGRFKASLHNVSSYLKEHGEVDKGLVEILRRSEALSDTGGREDAQEEKNAVALALLPAGVFLSAAERAALCASLELKFYIDPTLIEPEEGKLFAELIAKGVVNDALPAYLRIQNLSWKTKEMFIESSKKFHEFVTPEAIGSDLEMLLKSISVGDSTKEVIVTNAAAYANASDIQGLLQLGRYAADKRIEIDFELIDRLTKAKLDAGNVLKLLGMALGKITEPQLSSVLRELGEDYASLTALGKDRPKVPNTPDVIAILDFLTSHGVVNSYGAEKDFLRVNKKHK